MQDVRDKIGQVRPGFPKDVKEPLVAPRRPGEPAAGRLARRAVADDDAARSHVAHRPDHREGARERSRRRADRRQRPGDAADPRSRSSPTPVTSLGIGVDQVINAIRAANQDVPAGRITRGKTDSIVRIEGKIKDPAQFARIIVAPAGRRAGLPVAGRGRHRRREGGDVDLADQRPPVDHDRHPEIAGREHRRHGPRHHRRPRMR